MIPPPPTAKALRHPQEKVAAGWPPPQPLLVASKVVVRAVVCLVRLPRQAVSNDGSLFSEFGLIPPRPQAAVKAEARVGKYPII